VSSIVGPFGAVSVPEISPISFIPVPAVPPPPYVAPSEQISTRFYEQADWGTSDSEDGGVAVLEEEASDREALVSDEANSAMADTNPWAFRGWTSPGDQPHGPFMAEFEDAETGEVLAFARGFLAMVAFNPTSFYPMPKSEVIEALRQYPGTSRDSGYDFIPGLRIELG